MAASAEIDLVVMKIVSYDNSNRRCLKTLACGLRRHRRLRYGRDTGRVFVIGYPGIGGDTVTANRRQDSGFMDDNEDKVIDWFKTDVLVNQGEQRRHLR